MPGSSVGDASEQHLGKAGANPKVAAVFAEMVKQGQSQARQGTDGAGISVDVAGNQRPNLVSQIWTKDGKMTEAQARATFAYLQTSLFLDRAGHGRDVMLDEESVEHDQRQ